MMNNKHQQDKTPPTTASGAKNMQCFLRNECLKHNLKTAIECGGIRVKSDARDDNFVIIAVCTFHVVFEWKGREVHRFKSFHTYKDAFGFVQRWIKCQMSTPPRLGISVMECGPSHHALVRRKWIMDIDCKVSEILEEDRDFLQRFFPWMTTTTDADSDRILEEKMEEYTAKYSSTVCHFLTESGFVDSKHYAAFSIAQRHKRDDTSSRLAKISFHVTLHVMGSYPVWRYFMNKFEKTQVPEWAKLCKWRVKKKQQQQQQQQHEQQHQHQHQHQQQQQPQPPPKKEEETEDSSWFSIVPDEERFWVIWCFVDEAITANSKGQYMQTILSQKVVVKHQEHIPRFTFVGSYDSATAHKITSTTALHAAEEEEEFVLCSMSFPDNLCVQQSEKAEEIMATEMAHEEDEKGTIASSRKRKNGSSSSTTMQYDETTSVSRPFEENSSSSSLLLTSPALCWVKKLVLGAHGSLRPIPETGSNNPYLPFFATTEATASTTNKKKVLCHARVENISCCWRRLSVAGTLHRHAGNRNGVVFCYQDEKTGAVKVFCKCFSTKCQALCGCSWVELREYHLEKLLKLERQQEQQQKQQQQQEKTNKKILLTLTTGNT